jgi:hypothetical protein
MLPFAIPIITGSVGCRLWENTGIQSARRKSFFDFASLETNSAVVTIGNRAIEKTILPLVGS